MIELTKRSQIESEWQSVQPEHREHVREARRPSASDRAVRSRRQVRRLRVPAQGLSRFVSRRFLLGQLDE